MTIAELHGKLKGLSRGLAAWDRTEFGSVMGEIKKLKGELDSLRTQPGRTGPSHTETKIMDRLVELYHREEILWRQRARLEWLSHGDKNTYFFHLRASRRRRKNKIKALMRPDGSLTEDNQEMEGLVNAFYMNLYSSEGVQNMERVIDAVPRRVSEEMNVKLNAAYTQEEVKVALFQMFPVKSPGPDGFPAHFFQRHWGVCGEEVTNMVLRIVEGTESTESINETILVLIPKVATVYTIKGHPTGGSDLSILVLASSREGLSCLLKSRDESSNLHGIQVAPSAPHVNHLLFADDSLLFFKANSEGAEEVNQLLDIYCQATGQRINYGKSSIFFSKGVPDTIRAKVKSLIHVPNETLSEKYLGMPSDVGNSKNGAFKFLKDRLWSKIQGWIEKTLSTAGKEVLVKSVAQAVPVFSMSCFKLPRGLCEHLNMLIRKFWWGSKDGRRKPSWVSWKDMTQPKAMGGLGFKDFELFNLAMLAKQGWRILQEPDSLSARILKSVYFPNTTILQAQLGSKPSQIWRAIVEGVQVLKLGLIKRIGNGNDTDVWLDNWIPRDETLRAYGSRVANPPRLASDYFDYTMATWDKQKIEQTFMPMDVPAILSIPLSTRNFDDYWAWHFERNGVFSIRSAYRMLVATRQRREAWLEGSAGTSNSRTEELSWKALWRTQVPAKVHMFMWRLARQSLPTEDVRAHRNMAVTSSCGLCGSRDSWRHSLLECSMSRCVCALEEDEIVDRMIATQEPNAKQWIFTLLANLQHDKFV
ncbi:uncharacterized protein [Aegilops tauschii subsp. strangulata]|uniref:uncharacterized protein n=1 Tax=Aegilops tauschii subsp. strangulata TaxID=200361 RepID=UPI003CC89C99